MTPTHFKEPPTRDAKDQVPRPGVERVVSARDLLAGGRRVWIEHSAERYLLQVTRSGKLILTK